MMQETPLNITTAPPTALPRRRSNRALRVLLKSPLTVGSLLVLGLVTLCTVWPVAWLPHDPYVADISLRFVPPFWLEGGSTTYLLGTDALGRDLLSSIVAGARYSLAIVVLATALSLMLGVLSGLLAGFYRGPTDDLLMRLVDIQLAFPLIVLIIAIVAVLGPSFWNLVLVLGIAGWAPYARIVRGHVLSLREKEFVEAARALGIGNRRVVFRHLLPNVLTPIVILTTFELARLLLLESSLSFLGLGVQPPTPSWGAMIADSRQYLFEAWWASAIPGAMIVITVLAFNLVGDGLRDALDPYGQSS